MKDDIIQVTKNLVTLLVNSRFGEVVNREENGRLSSEDIKNALDDYPGTITIPPDSAYQKMYIYDVYDEKSEARKIEIDLWYDGNVSDLTLSADVSKGIDGKYKISIDDIHVL